MTELKPNDLYDVIFVVTRYTQIESATDILRANKTKNIVFAGNNVGLRLLPPPCPQRPSFLHLRPRQDIGKAIGWRPSI